MKHKTGEHYTDACVASQLTLPTKELIIKWSWKKSLNEVVKKKKPIYIYTFFQNKTNILHCNTATQVSVFHELLAYWDNRKWMIITGQVYLALTPSLIQNASMTRIYHWCLIKRVISAQIPEQHHFIKRHNLKYSLCIARYVSSWYSCWQKSPTPFTLSKPICGNQTRLSFVHSLGEQEDGENETTCKSISTSI